MRIFHIDPRSTRELAELPSQLPQEGFFWIGVTRREFEVGQARIQEALHRLAGSGLLDLHVSDVLNNQLPSHPAFTSQYDVLVFRRLATGQSETDLSRPGEPLSRPPPRRSGPPILHRIDTSPVGFGIFDSVLLTVHPASCTVLDTYATRLLASQRPDERSAGVRAPASPADLMLRIVNHMVDGYLDLRRELTRQLDHWQDELLDPHAPFRNWTALLDARLTLHQLDDICADQRDTLEDWIEAISAWPDADTDAGRRDRELLQVRSRDVLEHIERVVHHVRRLEHHAETAVQIHFAAQGNRTNDTMRTLTAVTAIFLPLNLIAAVFGMNFEFIPLLHEKAGFWWTLMGMGSVGVAMGLLFWRKRYLARSGR